MDKSSIQIADTKIMGDNSPVYSVWEKTKFSANNLETQETGISSNKVQYYFSCPHQFLYLSSVVTYDGAGKVKTKGNYHKKILSDEDIELVVPKGTDETKLKTLCE